MSKDFPCIFGSMVAIYTHDYAKHSLPDTGTAGKTHEKGRSRTWSINAGLHCSLLRGVSFKPNRCSSRKVYSHRAQGRGKENPPVKLGRPKMLKNGQKLTIYVGRDTKRALSAMATEQGKSISQLVRDFVKAAKSKEIHQ